MLASIFSLNVLQTALELGCIYGLLLRLILPQLVQVRSFLRYSVTRLTS